MPTPKTDIRMYKGRVIKVYDEDSKYFNNKYTNVSKSFFIQTDYNTGIEYKVPLRNIHNDEYMSNPNLNYVTQENMKFDYNYLYYIKDKFGQYDIQNIVNFQDQNYCPASVMNYRTFNNYPKYITEDQRRNSPYGYCSSPIIFWAPIDQHVYPTIELGRYWISTAGSIWDVKLGKPGRIQNCYRNGEYTTYKEFEFGCVGDRYRKCKLHRAVMLTFAYFPGCEQYEVNHKNGIHDDNRIENLEWVTRKENEQHALENGFHPFQTCQEKYGMTYAEYMDKRIQEKYGITLKELGSISGKKNHGRINNVRS